MKPLGLFVGGFVIGGILVDLWSGYAYSRVTVRKEVDAAFQAAQQAGWLAGLRLGESPKVIESMEHSMDLVIGTIADWETVGQPDEKTRKARDGFLTNVKVYHQSYPVAGSDRAKVTVLLAKIPSRSPQSKCNNWICRLDNLRVGGGLTKTNSP